MLSYSIKNESWIDGTFSISLGINIANFLPWSNASNGIAELNDRIRSTEIDLSQTMRNREDRLNQNFRTVETLLESMEATRLTVELAQSGYDMALDAFRRGGVDYQGLRTASDNLAKTRYNLLKVQSDLANAVLDIENELNIPFGTLSKGEVQ
jgi:outer membrane protein TolC